MDDGFNNLSANNMHSYKNLSIFDSKLEMVLLGLEKMIIRRINIVQNSIYLKNI